ncbi:serine/threonine protein kinase [Fortiea contorta]|uniref:serine/threonine protein kinase n=1 Tax=Fortiea contorta TaxID=1892405 RepID=UPI00034872E6|nr:serine/threonine-protein kinase [Fortiea contorta]
MSLCINPVCPQPQQSDDDENRFCAGCGSQLLLQGRYRVVRLLSESTGFSQVYEIRDQDTLKILKVLREDLAKDTKAVELFQQEASILKQLNHPGIPQVDEYFQYQTRNDLILHCIVMEKINGIDLEKWLQQQENQPISQAQAINWLRQLVEILNLLHSQQYLHRDIKPANIMLRFPVVEQDKGNLVLIDFGTASEITTDKTPIMSSGYSAVEQMSGEATPQSDFYALGRTFVFLLTGYHPLDMYDIQQNVLQWRDRAPHISPSLLNLIDWLMTPQIDKRPINAQEILQRLEAITQQLTPQPETAQLTPKNPRKKLPLLALLAALVASLGLIVVLGLIMRSLNFNPAINSAQTPQKKGQIDYFTYATGQDNQGRTAEFNIAILSGEYQWLAGSNFQIKNNDKIISLDLLKLNLEQENIQTIIEEPTEIISVGTASCGGKIKTAQRRALERAQQTQILAKKLFKNTATVQNYRLLNLGQFQRKDCQPNQNYTTYQTSVIIIGVRNKTPGVILDQALKNRLEKNPFADFKPRDYSLGSPAKFKTIPSNI